ncbi:DUF692 domain-containing protein [Ectothiorhodospira mobilis]|uniref:MNIO family bufferin maturase n=1 Tax=Ectothiorhodospira mobilis TaxID=195064 RepID=UPI001EE8F1C4|nr:DUF692 domain-containing protein [Ectothiorhodospira mobilis]MCG5535004.1 DUF692 domain-containing protein [Ectothiorhodospira mobilis]
MTTHTHDSRPPRPSPVPASAGVGLKPAHYKNILEDHPPVGWFEVHAENYMGDGGPPHHYLQAIRRDYPLSLHGVGLSIGGAGPLDREHLGRLAALVNRYEPGLFSEHLAWSTHDTGYLNDLLPLPYNETTLKRVCEHVQQVQDLLGRRMLLENPSRYFPLEGATLGEIEFLQELARRTGCGLLLDVNNVQISAVNNAFDPRDYLDAFPLWLVEEIHVAGHDRQQDAAGAPLLIDTHDRPVDATVWSLLGRVLERSGPRPVLVEWDSRIPAWEGLMSEARRAQACLDHALPEGAERHAITD